MSVTFVTYGRSKMIIFAIEIYEANQSLNVGDGRRKRLSWQLAIDSWQ
jgi:hypothetical protein